MSTKLMWISMIPALIFLAISYCSKSHADNLKWFVVPDAANPAVNVVVGAGGFTPPNAICQAPTDPSGKPYPIEALDIVDVADNTMDPTAPTHKVAQMNQAKLDAYNATQASAKAAADADKSTKATAKAGRIARIKAACAQLNGVQQDICNQVVDGL